MRVCLAIVLLGSSSHRMALADGTVVINEIYPDYANGGASWIELHNTSTTTVDLGYWQLDTGSSPDASYFDLPLETSISPGGYLVLEQSTTSLVIAKSGTIRLHALDLDSFEYTLVDQVDYTISDDGAAIARVPDGSSTWVVVSTPTKAAANPAPTPTPSPTYTITYAFSHSHTITHSFPDAHAYSYTFTYACSHPYTCPFAYTHSHAHIYRDAITNAFSHPRTNPNSHTFANAHASRVSEQREPQRRVQRDSSQPEY